MSPPSRSKATNIPSEVWDEILSLCSVEDTLKLERTCQFLRSIISSRHFWLKRLQCLDQAHAPDLPPHVSVSSLGYRDLRDLVVRARRRVLNRTSSSSLRISREIIIPIGQANVDGVLGKPLGWGADTLLSPGAQYFFIRWPAGYLQCWDVRDKECLWTYPELPSDRSDMRETRTKCAFACDMAENGDVHLAVVSETLGQDQRALEILGFSRHNPLSLLFRTKTEEIDVLHGLPAIVKLSGDVSVVYTEGYLTITFWKDDRSVVVREGIFDALEIINGYILGVASFCDGHSVVAISLKTAYHSTSTHVQLEDVLASSCRSSPPSSSLVGRAQLSLCTFHWREEGKRHDSVITVLRDAYDDQHYYDFPLVEFFSFGLETSGSSSEQSTHPILKSLGQTHFKAFDPQFTTYSIMTPPSQAGSTVLAFHDELSHETRFARTLATFASGKEVTIRILDETDVGGKPATFSLNVEFYSGAIYYVTKCLQNVVIRYFD
ncbi:hypothetical protein ACEPAF_5654 [Sanghuangporus sanghuang]